MEGGETSAQETHFDGAATLGQGGATEAQAGGEAGTAQPVEVDAPPPPHELAAELEPAASGEGVPEAPAEAPAGPGATVEQPSAPAQPEVKEEAAAGDAGELPAGGDALEAAAQGAEEAAKQEAEVKPEAGADVKQEGEGAAAEGPAPPSDEALAARLTELLREADLTTVTERALRRTLEAEYGVELASRKRLIRATVEEFLAAQEGGQEEEEEEEEEFEGEEGAEEASGTTGKRKRGRSSGSTLGSRLSPELAAFLGRETCPRTQVVKLLWEYIRAHNLQDPANRRRILLDDKLKTLFPGESTDMFKMNKHLSRHCKVDDRPAEERSEEEEEGSDEEEGSGSGDEQARGKRPRSRSSAAAASKHRRKSGGGSEGGKQRKPGGFQKSVRLSDEMAAWIGKSEASRPEVTKFFYAYVKEHDLHDPSNKQYVLADDNLKALTGESRIRAFGIQSLIKHHFLKD